MEKKRRKFIGKSKPTTDSGAEAEIKEALIKKIEPVFTKQIVKSMIAGSNLVWEEIYNDYVAKIDATKDSETRNRAISEMLCRIREKHLSISAATARDKNG